MLFLGGGGGAVKSLLRRLQQLGRELTRSHGGPICFFVDPSDFSGALVETWWVNGEGTFSYQIIFVSFNFDPTVQDMAGWRYISNPQHMEKVECAVPRKGLFFFSF